MKVIPFYLPQFHTFPENDNWWGKGFTEWTNTKKATPLFKGHYQPHIPYNNYYYDLLNIDTMRKQIDIAKAYGVYGFCFYHYWFKNGKKLMEKPVEMFLSHQELDIKFCLSWANEHWTRAWDGGNNEIIMEQEYGNREEWVNHYRYLKDFFLDKRYIYIDNKPLLIIYRPELIDKLKNMLDCWRELAKSDGFDGLYIVAQGTYYCRNISEKKHNDNLDGYIMYEPGYTYEAFGMRHGFASLLKNFITYTDFFIHYFPSKIKTRIYNLFNITPQKPMNLCKYSILCEAILKHKLYADYFPGFFTGWDNSARRGVKARIVTDSSPELFKKYLIRLLNKNFSSKYRKEFLFINAWNEWAEGAHLEPDEKYGYAYLEALKDALIETGEFLNFSDNAKQTYKKN